MTRLLWRLAEQVGVHPRELLGYVVIAVVGFGLSYVVILAAALVTIVRWLT